MSNQLTPPAPQMAWQPPVHKIGFVSGPLQHKPIAGAIYDVLTYDARTYTDLTYQAATERQGAGFYRNGYRVATVEEVFQYQLNALPQ